jgi:pimeloyl-ACP methyl ester carboxylesterase
MIWYKTIGDGPAKVVVIHGWFSDHSVFAPIFEALDTDRYTYAFIDIRGYGNSRDVAGSFTIGEIAADTIALADRLGWNEFHVIGHSMGGKAAQKAAMDASSRVKSIVAVTPVPACALPLDDTTFAFFSKACEDDGAALAAIGFRRCGCGMCCSAHARPRVRKRSKITWCRSSETTLPRAPAKLKCRCLSWPANTTKA